MLNELPHVQGETILTLWVNPPIILREYFAWEKKLSQWSLAYQLRKIMQTLHNHQNTKWGKSVRKVMPYFIPIKHENFGKATRVIYYFQTLQMDTCSEGDREMTPAVLQTSPLEVTMHLTSKPCLDKRVLCSRTHFNPLFPQSVPVDSCLDNQKD